MWHERLMNKLYTNGAYMSMTFMKKNYKILKVIKMLKEYREKKKITQEKLAEKSGIDRKTIFRIENDISIPKIQTYAKIVIALEMTNEEIGEHIRKIAIQ